MEGKRDLYERMLRKTHPNRVLVKGLESEALKLRKALSRVQRENRVLRAVRRIHRWSAAAGDRDGFLRGACDILAGEGAYREARISPRPLEEVRPAVFPADSAAALSETLGAALTHGGKTHGHLRVTTLPSGECRGEEIALLSMVAEDIALGLSLLEERRVGEMERKRPEREGGPRVRLAASGHTSMEPGAPS
jgi:hypothetical protein